LQLFATTEGMMRVLMQHFATVLDSRPAIAEEDIRKLVGVARH
jgi:hypothetical protein